GARRRRDTAGGTALRATLGGHRRAVGGDGPPSRSPGGDWPARAEAPGPVAPGGGGVGRRTPSRRGTRRAGEGSGARRRGGGPNRGPLPSRRYPDRTADASRRAVGRPGGRATRTGGAG